MCDAGSVFCYLRFVALVGPPRPLRGPPVWLRAPRIPCRRSFLLPVFLARIVKACSSHLNPHPSLCFYLLFFEYLFVDHVFLGRIIKRCSCFYLNENSFTFAICFVLTSAFVELAQPGTGRSWQGRF